MWKKASIVLALLVMLYLVTINFFGKAALYKEAVDFIVEKEFSNEYRNYKNLDIYVAFKEGDLYFNESNLDEKYKKFKLISSEVDFQKKRESEKYILTIIKPERKIEYGITDLGINVVRGNFTPGYYKKKYLWCFFSWIDLTTYERETSPY